MNDVVSCAPRTAAAYKSSYKPIWCPGCGDYSVLSSVTKALAKVGERDERQVSASNPQQASRHIRNREKANDRTQSRPLEAVVAALAL